MRPSARPSSGSTRADGEHGFVGAQPFCEQKLRGKEGGVGCLVVFEEGVWGCGIEGCFARRNGGGAARAGGSLGQQRAVAAGKNEYG